MMRLAQEDVSINMLDSVFHVFHHEVFFQGMKGKIDEYSDSDEDQHDAYLERMKAEGKIREEGNESDDSDSESGEWLFHYAQDKHFMLNLEYQWV